MRHFFAREPLFLLVLAAALLPGGCATDHSPEAVCRRQAEQDPQIQQLEFMSAHSMALAKTNAGKLDFLRQQDVLQCLQAKGVIPQGGVEPVEKPIP